jgi:fructokinase
MKNILSFGEVLWDGFGDGKKAGGAPMNVALHLAKQGANVSFASRVGMDASGYELIDYLTENNLYSNLIQQDQELMTCEVTISLNENQEAIYTFPEPISWDNMQTEEALTTAAKKSAAILFGSLACREATTRDTLLNLLNETNALKIFDVNLRAPHYTLSTIETLAARADIVKMNEEEAGLLINGSKGDLRDKITEFRKKYHAQTICVTRGENGAMVWHDYEFYEHPGFKVEVVDTVGAGDSFLATFINGLLNKQPIPKVLEKACAVGAYVTGKRGANPEYDEEIKKVLLA